MKPYLIRATGHWRTFDQTRSIRETFEGAKLRGCGQTSLINGANACLGNWSDADRRVAPELLLTRLTDNPGKIGFLDSSSLKLPLNKRCRPFFSGQQNHAGGVRIESVKNANLLARIYQAKKIFNVFRLNRPQGCIGSGAGLLTATTESSSYKKVTSLATSGSVVCGTR